MAKTGEMTILRVGTNDQENDTSELIDGDRTTCKTIELFAGEKSTTPYFVVIKLAFFVRYTVYGITLSTGKAE